MTRFHNLQQRVTAWVIRCFGLTILQDREERGLRLTEEAIELAQTLSIPRERLIKLVNVVYDRPVGATRQELAGTTVTLLAMAASLNIDLLDATEEEVTRIESFPPEHFRQRNIRKAADGVGNYANGV